MKFFASAIIIVCTISCTSSVKTEESKKEALPIEGTWKLLTGTLTEKGNTTVTDYTKDKSFIKVINNNHFAFLGHDLNKGKDSATAFYSSGGGVFELKDSAYTEKLEYCSDRQWEGNEFHFTVTIVNDTLIQRGVEKVESAGVDRVNVEKYIRMKN